MCGGQKSTEGDTVKTSSIIFYVSLFECKGPSMLKNDSLVFWGNIKYFIAQQIFVVLCAQ